MGIQPIEKTKVFGSEENSMEGVPHFRVLFYQRALGIPSLATVNFAWIFKEMFLVIEMIRIEAMVD